MSWYLLLLVVHKWLYKNQCNFFRLRIHEKKFCNTRFPHIKVVGKETYVLSCVNNRFRNRDAVSNMEGVVTFPLGNIDRFYPLFIEVVSICVPMSNLKWQAAENEKCFFFVGRSPSRGHIGSTSCSKNVPQADWLEQRNPCRDARTFHTSIERKRFERQSQSHATADVVSWIKSCFSTVSKL